MGKLVTTGTSRARRSFRTDKDEEQGQAGGLSLPSPDDEDRVVAASQRGGRLVRTGEETAKRSFTTASETRANKAQGTADRALHRTETAADRTGTANRRSRPQAILPEDQEEATGRTGGRLVRTGPGTAGRQFQSQAAQPVDREGQKEKANWWKIAAGTVAQGLGQVAKTGSSALAMLEGIPLGVLEALTGVEGTREQGLFYQLDQGVDQDLAAIQNWMQSDVQKAGKAGEAVSKYGSSVVAAVPQAVLAWLTAGSSLAAQETTAGLQAASAAATATGAAGIANTAQQAVRSMASDPSFQYSFLSTVGGEYQDAKKDGVSDEAAFAYATLASLLNSVVEVGGGLEEMPKKAGPGLRDWVETMIDEGKEEVIQGAISKLTQNAVYGKNNPLVSATDEDAVLNPRRAGEEFLGGAVVGGVLGGGQMALQNALNRSFQVELRRQLQGEDTQSGAEAAQTGPEAAGGIQAQPAAEGPQTAADGVQERPGGVNDTSETDTPVNTPTATPAESAAAPEAARPLPDLGAVKTMTDRMLRGGADQETAARLGLLLARAQAGQTLTGQEMAEIQGNRTATGALMAIEALRARQNETARTASRETVQAAESTEIVPFTEQEAQNLTSKRGVVSGRGGTFRQFIDSVKNLGNTVRFYFGKVPGALGSRIARAVGQDVTGYNIAIRSDEVKHALAQHGNTAREESRGQIPLTPEILERLPEVFNDPDEVVATEKRDYAGRVAFEARKQLDGYMVAVVGIANGKHSIEVDSVYVINRKGSPTTADATQNVSPSPTSETSSGQILSESNVSQNVRNVNRTAEGITMEPSTRASAPEVPAVQSVNIDGSNTNIPQGNQNVNQPAEGLSLPTPDDYQNGGTSYGAEQGAGALHGGRAERTAGAGAGRQSGAVQERTGRGTKWIQNPKAGNRADAVAASGAELRSAQDLLGLKNGSEYATLREAPDSVVNRERDLKTIREDGRSMGVNIRFFTGRPQVEGVQEINGLVRGDEVFIRIDSARWNPTQIWEHEKYHLLAAEDLELVRTTRDALLEEYGEEELLDLLQAYADAYAGAYGIDLQGQPEWTDEAMERVVEEVLADAYAGKDTYRKGADVYQGDVRSMAEQRQGGTERIRGPPDERYTFAGRNARGADSQSLAVAEQMERDNADWEDIWRETGWTRGMDGLWRFEIDDSGMEYSRFGDARFRQDHPEYQRYQELTNRYLQGDITQEEAGELQELGQTWSRELPRLNERVNRGAATLENLIRHDELFRNYPQLRNVRVTFEPMGDTWGYYDPENNRIALNESFRKSYMSEQAQRTIIHEIQHAIQDAEGFTPGASPEYWERSANDPESPAGRQRAEVEERLRRSIAEDREAMENGEVLPKYERSVRQQIQQDEWRLRNLDYYLYDLTAGEIEARDTADRRNLTAEQRRETEPSMDHPEAVFAGQGEEGFSQAALDSEEAAGYDDGRERTAEWARDAIITPAAGSVAEAESRMAAGDYGARAFVVSEETWVRRHGENAAPAYTEGGRVYLRENIPEEYRGMIVPHEFTHVMRQTGFRPYLEFLDELPDMLDFSEDSTQRLVQGIAAVRGIDPFSGNQEDIRTLYDEVNATIYGSIATGDTAALDIIRDAFWDFDGYAAELTALHERFKTERGGNGYADDTRGSEQDPAGGQRQADTGGTESVRGGHRGDAAGRVVPPGQRYAERQGEAGNEGELQGLSLPTLEEDSGGTRFSMEGPVEDSQGRELTPEQQDYFRDSQARDESGKLLTLYHQTENEFTVFDPRHAGAGTKDDGTPFGIFMKTSPRDIGIRGSRQMELYADIQNPLRVNDREELRQTLEDLSPEYASLIEEHRRLDEEYHEKFEAAKKAWREFATNWRRDNPDAGRRALYDVPEFNTLFEAEDTVVDEWTAKADELSVRAKEALTEALRNAGYDGVVITEDAGSWGRRTDAYIALDPEQVKNATNQKPTRNPDIRFSTEGDRQAREDLEKELEEIFPGVQRSELRALSADIRNGASDDRLEETFGRLYGEATVFDYDSGAQELMDAVNALKGRRVYVSPETKAEFGDDWQNIRRKAFGKRLYFTNNRADQGLDTLNEELSGQHGGFFNALETDQAGVVSRIMDLLDQSRDVQISLDEEAARYGGPEAVQRFREDYRQRFRDAVDAWRSARDRGTAQTAGQSAQVATENARGAAENARTVTENAQATAENARTAGQSARETERRRRRQELDGYVEQARNILRERAGQGLPMPERTAVRAPEGMDIDQYTADLEARSARAKAERMRTVDREDFRGTAAMEKLGIRVEGSVADYQNAEQLRRNHEAAESIRREIRRAEKRLNATPEEREFAAGVAAGAIAEEHIPEDMRGTVLELADYYMAERSFGTNLLRQRRTDINAQLSEQADHYFADTETAKVSGAFTLNNRTPTRNLLKIFGDQKGAEISRWLVEPVARNESERTRFINRMLDQVRTFEDSKGRQRRLSRDERALTQMVMEGRAAGEMVAASEMREAIENAARDIRSGLDPEEAGFQYRLDQKGRKLAAQYAGWLEVQEQLDSGKVDKVKVEHAADRYSELYNQFYEAINDFLVVHGYEPIGFIKGYAPHMQTEEDLGLLSNALKSMGLTNDVTKLPASIAGLTKDFRPNKPWNRFFQHRTGDTTDYDVARGFERYVDAMSDVLYHTDDIMRVRQASNYFRRTYAPENIRETISWARELNGASTAEKRAFLKDQGVISNTSAMSAGDVDKAMEDFVERQYQEAKDVTKFSDFVVYLEDYANNLANKQVFADRDMERTLGRTSLNIGNKLTNAFARAQVAGNLSSALNQTAQLSQISSELGAKYTARAMADILRGQTRRAAWNTDSDFLTEKKGVNYLVNTTGDMVIDGLFKPLEFVDGLMSTLAVRGKYLQEIDRGKDHQAAMRAADDYGRRVMGSRAKGSIPLAFQSKNLVNRMLHMFQVEALNSWEHVTQDLPRDFRTIQREQGKVKAAGAAAGVIVKMLLSAFVLNRLDEELYGGTPTPYDVLGLGANFMASGEGLTTNDWLRTVMDNGWERLTGERLFDTDEEALDGGFDWGAAAEDTWYNVSNDIPYLRNAAALLGWGDETLPMPDLQGAFSDIRDAATGEDAGMLSGEMGQALFGLATDLLPAGRQIEKTAQGLDTVIRGGRYRGYGDQARLQNTGATDFWDAVRGAMFGNSAMTETGRFYAGDDTALTAKQTQLHDSLVDGGANSREVYQAIQDWRRADDDKELSSVEVGQLRRAMVDSLDLTDEQKLELYGGLSGSESRTEDFRELVRGGMDLGTVFAAYDRYAELYADEDMRASEKATAYARWADEHLTASEAKAVKEQFPFFSMVPAKAGRYEGLTEAGLDTEDAYELTQALDRLEPEEGRDTVSNLQKYQAVAGSGLSQRDQEDAIRSMLQDTALEKFDALMDAGLTPAEWVDYKTATKDVSADKDLNGKTISGSKKAKVLRIIDGMDLTAAQKTALYLDAGYTASTLDDAPWYSGGLSLPKL